MCVFVCLFFYLLRKTFLAATVGAVAIFAVVAIFAAVELATDDANDDEVFFQSPKRLQAFFHLHWVHHKSFFSIPYCLRHFLFSPRGRRFGDNGERWITDAAATQLKKVKLKFHFFSNRFKTVQTNQLTSNGGRLCWCTV